ncbi:MAG TPA: hypothetical protein VGH95_05840 [Candidatus Aquirickettsiella sp.]|jgi:hypothetical protein
MTQLNKNPITEPKDSFHRQLAIQHAHTAHRLVQQRYANDAKPIFVDKGR